MNESCVHKYLNTSIPIIPLSLLNLCHGFKFLLVNISINKCFAILSFIKLSNLDHLKTQILFFLKIIKNIFENLF